MLGLIHFIAFGLMASQAISMATSKEIPPDLQQKFLETLRKIKESTKAECPRGQLPAYMAVQNKALISPFGNLVYLGLTEAECMSMCSDNRDLGGNNLLCSSMSYEPTIANCTISRRLAMPRGNDELVMMEGSTYLEKFCLPAKAPSVCGEAIFFRSPQAILPGFAVSVVEANSTEECIEACITAKDISCKSVMYYYKDKECILNTASATTGSVLVREDKDKVEYIENGCLNENQLVLNKKLTAPSGKVVDLSAVSGIWGNWTDWSACNPTAGVKVRTRQCVMGKCIGDEVETKACEFQGWSAWSEPCQPFTFEVQDRCLGFQLRVCLGSMPDKCPGPHFRYCFLPQCQAPEGTFPRNGPFGAADDQGGVMNAPTPNISPSAVVVSPRQFPVKFSIPNRQRARPQMNPESFPMPENQNFQNPRFGPQRRGRPSRFPMNGGMPQQGPNSGGEQNFNGPPPDFQGPPPQGFQGPQDQFQGPPQDFNDQFNNQGGPPMPFENNQQPMNFENQGPPPNGFPMDQGPPQGFAGPPPPGFDGPPPQGFNEPPPQHFEPQNNFQGEPPMPDQFQPQMPGNGPEFAQPPGDFHNSGPEERMNIPFKSSSKN